MWKKKFLVVFLILFFPSAAYLLLHTGKNNYRTLAIYGPRDVNAAGDTLYHTVHGFRMTDEEGKPFTDRDLNGRIHVASFFFATCPDICPKMNEQVKRVADKFADNPEVEFLSYTVNPEHDSSAVLAEYKHNLETKSKSWHFLTGVKDSIYALAGNGYLLYAAQGKEAGQFFHSQDLILVDKEMRIRGIYDGLEPKEVDTLIDEINVLLYEYKSKKNVE
jgi:protein SCO1/2